MHINKQSPILLQLVKKFGQIIKGRWFNCEEPETEGEIEAACGKPRRGVFPELPAQVCGAQAAEEGGDGWRVGEEGWEAQEEAGVGREEEEEEEKEEEEEEKGKAEEEEEHQGPGWKKPRSQGYCQGKFFCNGLVELPFQKKNIR